MRKLCLLLGLAVVLAASAANAAHISMTLVGPSGPVAVDSFFDVFVEIDTDIDIAMVQVVLDLPDPAIELQSVASPLASLAFINPPDTAVADYFPTTHTGTFTAMVIQMYVGPAADYPLDLVLMPASSFSTAVFDELYNPSWDIEVVGTTVVVGEEIIPEPATIGLLALVGLGSVIAGRKK